MCWLPTIINLVIVIILLIDRLVLLHRLWAMSNLVNAFRAEVKTLHDVRDALLELLHRQTTERSNN